MNYKLKALLSTIVTLTIIALIVLSVTTKIGGMIFLYLIIGGVIFGGIYIVYYMWRYYWEARE